MFLYIQRPLVNRVFQHPHDTETGECDEKTSHRSAQFSRILKDSTFLDIIANDKFRQIPGISKYSFRVELQLFTCQTKQLT